MISIRMPFVFSAIVVAAFVTCSARAQPVAWTDWTSSTSGLSGSGAGTISPGSTPAVSVNYVGEVFFAQTAGGTNYWVPNSPYISSTVPNSPPDADIVTLRGGNTALNVLTFSTPVADPIVAICSLGDPVSPVNYQFNAPFDILSFGPGFFGGPGTLTQTPGNVLMGVEGHGTIRFPGVHSSLTGPRHNSNNGTASPSASLLCPSLVH